MEKRGKKNNKRQLNFDKNVTGIMSSFTTSHYGLILSLDQGLKGHRHDWSKFFFTKTILREILQEFLQKVIKKCTNHFGKD